MAYSETVWHIPRQLKKLRNMNEVGMQAIQKGSIDSCREAHQDWLAKVQATLAAPAHVQAPTPSTLASLHSLQPPHLTSFTASAQVKPFAKCAQTMPKPYVCTLCVNLMCTLMCALCVMPVCAPHALQPLCAHLMCESYSARPSGGNPAGEIDMCTACFAMLVNDSW